MTEWDHVLKPEFALPYMKELSQFLKSEIRSGKTIYPAGKNMLKAFDLTPLPQVKVVVIGQDPYHGQGQAHGLSFSVPQGVTAPPSLKNIFKQIHNDFGPEIKFQSGCLTPWAQQGVFLLNSVLSVEAGKPASHANKGWERFTDKIVAVLNEIPRPIVFMLWGSYAKSKGKQLNNPQHLVLSSPHPSPFSAHSGFLGNGHFKTANEFLERNALAPIDWNIP